MGVQEVHIEDKKLDFRVNHGHISPKRVARVITWDKVRSNVRHIKIHGHTSGKPYTCITQNVRMRSYALVQNDRGSECPVPQDHSHDTTRDKI